MKNYENKLLAALDEGLTMQKKKIKKLNNPGANLNGLFGGLGSKLGKAV